MNQSPQLESYLEALDKALGPVPVSARADIITEIKSHVMDAQERDPNATLGGILSSLGEPQTVANRYLLERGLKPGRAPRAPILKWLTVGFLGTFGIICLTLIILVWRFTPLISVDEKTDHIVLLGGAIDVHGDTGSIKFGDTRIDALESDRRITGSEDLDPKKISEVRIPFTSGKVTLKSSSDGRVHWSCKAMMAKTAVNADVFTFDFGPSGTMSCEISVPNEIKPSIHGINGKVTVEKVKSDLDVHLVSGKLEFEPDPLAHYKYNLHLKMGRVGDFESSSDPKAFVINVDMESGKISKE